MKSTYERQRKELKQGKIKVNKQQQKNTNDKGSKKRSKNQPKKNSKKHSKKSIRESTGTSSEGEDTPDTEPEAQAEPEVSELGTGALQAVKLRWPNLFTLTGMRVHHERLTGRNLEKSLQRFLRSGEVDILLMFLVSSCETKTNHLNLAERINAETYSQDFPPATQLIAVSKMLCSYLSEEFKELLIPVEVSCSSNTNETCN